MSNVLSRAARGLRMPPNDKAVLMALADMARDPDDPERPCQAWPPMHGKDGAVGLCDWTCLSERAVQRSVGALKAAGLIERRQLSHGALYTVNLTVSPVPQSPDYQSGDCQSPDCQTPSPVPQSPKALGSTNLSKKASPSQRGTRLDPAFEMPGDWLAYAMAERGWDRAAAQTVADGFKDFWIGKPGKDGRKADWLATWRNWVRNQRGNAHGNNSGGYQPSAALALGRRADTELAAQGSPSYNEDDFAGWPALSAD